MEFPKASRTYNYELPPVPVGCLADGCSFLAAGPSPESNHRMVLVHMTFAEQDESHKIAVDTWFQFFDDDFDPLFDEAPDDREVVLQKVRVPYMWLFSECPVPTCRVNITEASRERLYSHLFEEHEAIEVEIFLGLRQIGGQASNGGSAVVVVPARKSQATDETGPKEKDSGPNVHASKARRGGSARRRRKATTTSFAFEEWAHKKREQMRIEMIRRNLKRKYVKEGNDIPMKGSPEYASWYKQIDQDARRQYQTELSNGGSAQELRVTESVDDLLEINHILKANLDNYVREGNNIPYRHLREFGGFWQHMHKVACDEYHQNRLRQCVGKRMGGPESLAQSTQGMPMTDIGNDHIQTCAGNATQQLNECNMDQHNSSGPSPDLDLDLDPAAFVGETNECFERLSSLNGLIRGEQEDIHERTDRLEDDEFECSALLQIREDIKNQYMMAGYTIPDLGTQEYLHWFRAVDKMARKIYDEPELPIKQEPMYEDGSG
ncbi:hypothetical protein V1509DRAFT_616261 [Lipomyces kononenkoae]